MKKKVILFCCPKNHLDVHNINNDPFNLFFILGKFLFNL